MKKSILLITLLAGAGTAYAGFRYPGAQVQIGSTYAAGTVSAARASTDGVQYIDCGRYASASFVSVTCYARDATGKSAMCSTTNATLVAEARAIKGDSDLEFTWDANGTCTALYVHDGSQYAPKSP